MQNCRHFWTCVSSSRLKSVNIHTDRASPCRETQNCRHFWTCVSSSHLKSVNMHKDPGVLVAKRRTVVTVGLAFGRRVSKASTLTRIGGVLVAKCRTVVTLVHVFCPPLSLLKVLLPSLARHLSTALLPPAFPSWSSLASIVATLSLDILIKFPADKHLKFPAPPPLLFPSSIECWSLSSLPTPSPIPQAPPASGSTAECPCTGHKCSKFLHALPPTASHQKQDLLTWPSCTSTSRV